MRFARYFFVAAAALPLVLALNVEAGPITYTFLVTATSGPLNGATANGTFTYDTSSIVPGGSNDNTRLLTALDFTWHGIHYDQTTANTGFLHFDVTGTLTNEVFGNHCFAGGCGTMFGTEQWFVAFVFPGFAYSIVGDGGGLGRVTQALATAATPEPSTLVLLGAGLALAGIICRRRDRRIG